MFQHGFVLFLFGFQMVILGVFATDIKPSLKYISKLEAKAKQLLENSEAKFKNGQISKQCNNAFDTQYWGILAGKSWAWQMIDAHSVQYEDLPGFFESNVHATGAYDFCLSTKATYETVTPPWPDPARLHDFDAKYCRLQWSNHTLDSGVSEAVCVPDKCNNTEVIAVFMDKVVPDKTLKYVYCGEREPINQNIGAILTITLLSIFGLLVIVATAFDYFTKAKQRIHPNEEPNPPGRKMYMDGGVINVAGPEQVAPNIEGPSYTNHMESKAKPTPGKLRRALLAFSLCNNFPSLASTKSPRGSYKAMNGLRFFAMTWIIVGHSFQLGIWILIDPRHYFVRNYLGQFRYHPYFMYQMIGQMNLSVEIFFLLSSCLVMVSFLKTLDRLQHIIKGKSGCQKMVIALKEYSIYVLHRYIRLTPVIGVLILVIAYLWLYMGNGPLFPADDFLPVRFCREYGWMNLFYVQNYVDPTQVCMGWTWYVANDLTFYLFVPFYALLLKRSPIVGGVVMFLAWCGYFAVRMTLKMTVPGERDYVEIYVKPYTRYGPYIMGMAIGYILYRTKGKVKIHVVLVIIGWIMAFVLGMLAVFGYYGRGCTAFSYCIPWPGNLLQVFEACQRDVFSLAMAWVVFACSTGYGGPLNAFFSMKIWIPLSKLTYTGYLVHPILQHLYLMNMRQPMYANAPEVLYYYIGTLALTMVVSMVLTLVFEMPVLELEKIILPKAPSKKRSKPKEEENTAVPNGQTRQEMKTNMNVSEAEVGIEHYSIPSQNMARYRAENTTVLRSQRF